MDAINFAVGAGGCQIVKGASATPVKTGFRALACSVRIALTQIKSVTQVNRSTGVSETVTNESWESEDLYANELIVFSAPVTSITLNSVTDSVILWLEPTY